MSDNNRIAKNTMFLYIRMLIMMLLGLYTSRIVLEMLGINDYGIFNVVGGLVALVSYINQAMSNSSIRYLTFSIGNPIKYSINKVFNTTLMTHFLLAAIVLCLIETIGLWFLYNKLVIPECRMSAAFWVFQFSAIGTFLTIITIPYTAIIIANERMSVFAYFTILDAVIKLGIALILSLSTGDRLELYGGLLLGTQILYLLMYFIYCVKHFSECHLTMQTDKGLVKEILSFSGWSLVGCTASICNTQGLNILLNLFGGPVLNAARGIAVQVQSIVNNFAVNFQTAVNPQIIKLYARDSIPELHMLIYRSAKFAFYLLYFICLPLLLNMNTVLHWWLVDVPDYTVVFLTLILIITLLDSMSNPLMKAADATGKIRRYHLCVGGWLLLVLPVSYILLNLGFPPYVVFIVQLIFSIGALFVRLFILRNMIYMPIISYMRNVLLPVFLVVSVSLPLPLWVSTFDVHSSAVKFFGVCAICVISTIMSTFYLGMSPAEQAFLKSKILNRFVHK